MLIFQNSQESKEQSSINYVAKLLEDLSQSLFKKCLADID